MAQEQKHAREDKTQLYSHEDDKRHDKDDMLHMREDDTPSVTSITPPDGGWGWVVVFASFMIHVIADGITYSFGIFMVELMVEFEADRSVASLIPSILVGVTLGAGPIASSLVNRYGCRLVTIAGALLASFGLAISTLAKSITLLYFTIGICTGIDSQLDFC
jgi:MFS family permease